MPENPVLEKDVLDWVLETRALDTCVTTDDIICKATALDPTFKNGDSKKLHLWVYKFLIHDSISVRTETRIGRKLASDMEAVQREYSKRFMVQYFFIVNNAKLLSIWTKLKFTSTANLNAL